MKKRTFEQRQTNIILNPDPEKEQGKRIVRPIEVSPDHMLTENPKSNQNLYFFSESPICL